MTKAKAEKRILFLFGLIRRIWFRYLDSLDTDGNEIAKEQGYLTLTIFRSSCWVNSSLKENEMKKENQISIDLINHGGKYEVADYTKG